MLPHRMGYALLVAVAFSLGVLLAAAATHAVARVVLGAPASLEAPAQGSPRDRSLPFIEC